MTFAVVWVMFDFNWQSVLDLVCAPHFSPDCFGSEIFFAP
jgi:hypothetical protein